MSEPAREVWCERCRKLQPTDDSQPQLRLTQTLRLFRCAVCGHSQWEPIGPVGQ